MGDAATTKITPIRAELPPMDTPRRRGRRLPIVITVVALLVAAGAFAGYRYIYEPAATFSLPSGRVTISPVTSRPFVDYIALRGQVVPAVTVSITPEISGRVEEVLVDPGDAVKAGEVLVRIANPGFELDLLAREAQAIEQINGQKSLRVASRARLDEMEREMASVRFRILQIEDELSRLEPLVAGGSQPSSSLDRLQQELTYQGEFVELLKRQAADEKTSFGEIGDSLADTVELLSEMTQRRTVQLDALAIRAPIDGTVNGLDLVPGEQLAEGMSIGNVDANDVFKVVFMADEFYLPRVAVGQRVVTILGHSEHEMTVADISPRVENGQFRLEATFNGPQPASGLLRGRAMSARLVTDESDEVALSLPTGAFLESSGGRWVYKVGSDGAAVKVPVSLGRRTNERVEVLSGLEEGDRVITSAYGAYAHLDTVRVSQEEP
jgi:HlyD family secretion protein